MSEQAVEQDKQEPQKTEAPKGTEAVDFSELPEEVRDKFEARFKRVYGNMKEYERIARTLETDQKTLLERLEKVESTQVQDRAEQRFASIRSEKEAALANGDFEKVRALDDQLEATIKEYAKPEKKEPPMEAAHIPPEVETAIVEWANEIDGEGNFKRPWAQPTHGKYQEAISIAQQVYDDPEWRSQGISPILTEIDRRTKAVLFPSRSRAQTVLSGDGSVTPRKDSPVKLSADQIEAAHFLYRTEKVKDKDSGRLRLMTPREMEDRYAKALKG